MSAPIDIREIRQAARDIIKASSYFTDIAVLLNNGRIQDEIEEAISGVGKCVVVQPLAEGNLAGQAGTAFTHDVILPVSYAVNPAKSQTDVLELYVKGSAALLGYSAAEKRNNFRSAETSFLIDLDDQGIWAYTGLYLKLAAMRYTD